MPAKKKVKAPIAKVPVEKTPIVSTASHETQMGENRFHHLEEVALHQEKQKVTEAMSTRRNAKRYFRVKGDK